MSELQVLQAARLKGRLSLAAAASSAGVTEARAEGVLSDLVRAEVLTERSGSWRMTPAGRERLAFLLEQERESVDVEALESVYQEFDVVNHRLKGLMTDWQLKDGEPNDHSNAEYDGRVIALLHGLHKDFVPLLDRIVELAPRLTTYSTRLTHAVNKLEAGDHSYLAHPTIDSYHAVWFELHEELIGLLGRTRAGEAAAGRAV